MEKKLLGIVLAFFAVPLVSALDGGPIDNEWVKFGIIFALLFVAMYTFFNNRMDNPVVSGVIAGGLSALITIPILKRGLLDAFLEPWIVDWVIVIALGIGLLFLFYKFGLKTKPDGTKGLSFTRFIIFLIILALITPIIKDVLPETWLFGPFGTFIDWVDGLSWWAVVLIAGGLIVVWIWRWWRVGRGHYRAGKRKMAGEIVSKQGGWLASRRMRKAERAARRAQQVKVTHGRTIPPYG